MLSVICCQLSEVWKKEKIPISTNQSLFFAPGSWFCYQRYEVKQNLSLYSKISYLLSEVRSMKSEVWSLKFYYEMKLNCLNAQYCCQLSVVSCLKYEVLLWNEAKLSQYSIPNTVVSCQLSVNWLGGTLIGLILMIIMVKII